MLLKTILNSIDKYKSFIYQQAFFEVISGIKSIVIEIASRKNSKAKCSVCSQPYSTYDHLSQRDFEHIPVWHIPIYFRYRPRRVNCPEHGVVVESLPWAQGKERMTTSYKLFLASWAKRLSWRETAIVFRTSWDSVYRSVKWVVEYGLDNRDWDGVTKIGVDEIAVFKGHRYLTCVYQLDQGMKRLLWCGKDRRVKTLLRFFREFGKDRCEGLVFVCSDMWAPYLKVIKKKCTNALNVLDRFHIVKKFGDAVDQVRRDDVNRFKANKEENVLAKGRWLLLKNKENLTDKQTSKLGDLLKLNLNSIRAYLMKEDFQRFWGFKSVDLAEKFMDDWIDRAMKSTLWPMKKVAKMLRRHKGLILNWFHANGELSSGAVEGLNNRAIA